MPTAQRPRITMSKESSSSKMPSNEELEKFTKIELIAFLKSLGVGHTGNRKQLVTMATASDSYSPPSAPSTGPVDFAKCVEMEMPRRRTERRWWLR